VVSAGRKWDTYLEREIVIIVIIIEYITSPMVGDDVARALHHPCIVRDELGY
jgi:hypothetical protein